MDTGTRSLYDFPDASSWTIRPRAAEKFSDGMVTLRYEVELITPMVGGGVTPKRVDLKRAFRSRPILGQLRYWWRRLAISGRLPCGDGMYFERTSGPELYELERARFGGLKADGSVPAPITIQVTLPRSETLKLLDENRAKVLAPYFLYTLDKTDTAAVLDAFVTPTVTFGLSLCVPSVWAAEYREAVRWWSQFGGLGARTTRGMGGISVSEDGVPLQPIQADEALRAGARLAVHPETFLTARDALSALSTRLRLFRQGHDARAVLSSHLRPHWAGCRAQGGDALVAMQARLPQLLDAAGCDSTVRPPGSLWLAPNTRTGNIELNYRPGRTTWPGADSLRTIYAQRARVPGLKIGHPLLQGADPKPVFPLTAFGLPIVGRQLHGNHRVDNSPSESLPGSNFSIALKTGEHMRSPLRLRVQKLSADRFLAIALLFEDERDWALEQRVSIKLKGEPDEDFPIWNVGKGAKHSKDIAPMAQFGGGARDPLSAFLHYFASNSP